MYKISIGIICFVVLGLAYYGILPLFKHARIDEAAPLPKETVPMIDASSHEQEEGMLTGAPNHMREGDLSMSDSDKNQKMMSADGADHSVKEESVKIELPALVVGTAGHPASGEVHVIRTDTGAVVRYENFKTISGPDLFVYLAKDLDANDFVNLGELRATEGNVNYEVPQNVNIQEYKYVMVWCKQFGELFNYADLT